MDFGFLAQLSWREALLALVVLLALYILFAFLHIHRLWDETRRVRELPPSVIRDAVSSYTAVQEEKAPEAQPSPAVEAPRFVQNDARQIEMLEQDLTQLRREIGSLRAELQALREEQRREPGKAQPAWQGSPFYNGAMQLATQGREAADISALCDISRAEAELLVALARNGGPEAFREMR